MVELLVILDGASERSGEGPTSLERAYTPALDRLAREGELSRLRTTPAHLPAGSETAIPVLLGWTPAARVDRGMIEAAARGVGVPVGHHAWRVDVVDGRGDRAGGEAVAAAAARLGETLPGYRVRAVGGHRLLVTGPRGLLAPAGGAALRWWPEGEVPPSVLDASTVVVAAPAAAAGLGRLMGAAVVVPPGATGGTDTDLGAKLAAAEGAARRAARVVVHVGAPDEAAHERDPEAKIRAIERIDAELIAHLPAIAREHGADLRVCPDHGCDPRTGLHDDGPVPCVDWSPSAPRSGRPGARLTERAVRDLPVAEPAAAPVGAR